MAAISFRIVWLSRYLPVIPSGVHGDYIAALASVYLTPSHQSPLAPFTNIV